MITRPTGLGLADWTTQVSLDLDSFGVVGRMVNDDWQAWGSQLLNNVAIGGSLPSPYGFNSWQEWAERLCGVL